MTNCWTVSGESAAGAFRVFSSYVHGLLKHLDREGFAPRVVLDQFGLSFEFLRQSDVRRAESAPVRRERIEYHLIGFGGAIVGNRTTAYWPSARASSSYSGGLAALRMRTRSIKGASASQRDQRERFHLERVSPLRIVPPQAGGGLDRAFRLLESGPRIGVEQALKLAHLPAVFVQVAHWMCLFRGRSQQEPKQRRRISIHFSAIAQSRQTEAQRSPGMGRATVTVT